MRKSGSWGGRSNTNSSTPPTSDVSMMMPRGNPIARRDSTTRGRHDQADEGKQQGLSARLAARLANVTKTALPRPFEPFSGVSEVLRLTLRVLPC